MCDVKKNNFGCLGMLSDPNQGSVRTKNRGNEKTMESEGVGVGESLDSNDWESLSITKCMDQGSDLWFLDSSYMYHS